MRRHDPPALEFEGWYRREFPRVRQAMTMATGDAGLGEEAAAEAFALALVHWGRVSGMDSPGGWVYATALNQVRRSWRRTALEQRHQARTRQAPVPPPEPPDTALWRAVAQLSPRARTAIALRYVADLPEAEVAAAMNVSRGTVATTLSRARKHLAALLEPAMNGDRP
ncbi:RNA polymerase sigma factor [Cellulomonas rhizosphaerae]|uniref:Sigma-70 family RNA polymerase sigma factor n=1 Tax=Cellulomonas rhizosphaerae TaxID=2293719 RepID=A0A413RJ46_9CELL|nr:sigma-70 family RNA polymerase sigma factor [Cellulomonas rhizosphaerae]